MTTHSSGEQQQRPVGGATIVLNDAMFAGRRTTQEHFARLVGEAASSAAGRDAGDVERIVREAVHRSALDLPEVQVDRLVEQIIRSGGIARITDDAGQTLYPRVTDAVRPRDTQQR